MGMGQKLWVWSEIPASGLRLGIELFLIPDPYSSLGFTFRYRTVLNSRNTSLGFTFRYRTVLNSRPK